ncbi:hypothetical protein D3C86_875300 [compost metagenome]
MAVIAMRIVQREDHVHVEPRQHDGRAGRQHRQRAARAVFAMQLNPQRHQHHAGQRHAAPQHADTAHVLLLGAHVQGRRAGLAEYPRRQHQEHQRSRIKTQQQRQPGGTAPDVRAGAHRQEQQAAQHQAPMRVKERQAVDGRCGGVWLRFVRNRLGHEGSKCGATCEGSHVRQDPNANRSPANPPARRRTITTRDGCAWRCPARPPPP